MLELTHVVQSRSKEGQPLWKEQLDDSASKVNHSQRSMLWHPFWHSSRVARII